MKKTKLGLTLGVYVLLSMCGIPTSYAQSTLRCIAPANKTIYCDDACLDYIEDAQASKACFGNITITGSSGLRMDTVYSTEKNLKCGYGTIKRKWQITRINDGAKTTCEQIVTINPVHQYNIYFPKDVSADCSSNISDTVLTDELSCDILAVNVDDKRYDASDDECYKIFRTYTVINWCTYDDRCGDYSEANNIFVVPRDWKNNYGAAPVYVLVRDANLDSSEEFYLSKDSTPGNAGDERFTPPFCSITGEFYHSFMYTQIIKIYDDVRPVVTGDPAKFCIREGGDCLADLKMVITGKDNCSAVTLETQYLSIAPGQTLNAREIIFYNRINWITKDLGNGQFEINVKDFPQGKHDLIVVVRDECGNLSLPTRIPFTVENCNGSSSDCISISGKIRKEDGTPVPSVNVYLLGGASDSTTTNALGEYAFYNLSSGSDYTVYPKLDTNPLEGVSIYDYLLSRFDILNVQPLNSPYKLIAADVNNSGSFNSVDLTLFQRTWRNNIDRFPNNTSWRFVDASYQFPSPTYPWSPPFPEVINANDLNGSVTANFIAIKIGDIGKGTVNNSRPTLVLDLSDASVTTTGQEVCQSINTTNFTNINGIEATIKYNSDELDFSAVKNFNLSGLSASSFGLPGVDFNPEGAIKLVWLANSSSALPDNTAIFDVCFTPKLNNTRLTTRFNSNAEIINQDYELVNFSGRSGEISVGSPPSPTGTGCGCYNVTVTLDANCQFKLTRDLVSDGFCPNASVRVLDNKNTNGDTIDCAGVWTYGLFSSTAADAYVICWGKVTAEDKTAPVLVCAPADITLDCYDVNYVLSNKLTIGNVGATSSPAPATTGTQTINNAEGVAGTGDNCQLGLIPPGLVADNIKNLGYAYFKDNCFGCGCRVTLKWSDKVIYYTCNEMKTNGGIYATISREWVATDCNGMSSNYVQTIYFKHPTVDDFVFNGPGEGEYDRVVSYVSSTPDKNLIKKADVTPYHCSYFNTATNPRCLYIDEVKCNYSVTIKDNERSTCDGKGIIIDRKMYVFDLCAGGTLDSFHILIKIGANDPAPVPNCVNGLIAELVSDGSGGGIKNILATDFVAIPIYHCDGQGPETLNGKKKITKYSINRVGSPVNKDQTGLNLSCADLGKRIDIELHAWDESGNHGFCTTYVEVQDNRKVCLSTNTGTGKISGNISQTNGIPVEGVNVTLSGGSNQVTSTDAQGNYTFSGLPTGNNYTVTPYSNAKPLNGITVDDHTLIYHYTQGSVVFNNPYNLIAADINNDKKVTISDVEAASRLVLNLDNKINGNTSWRFIDKNFKFPNPKDPWQTVFPEVVNINSLVQSAEASFIAVKVGDVNNTASGFLGNIREFSLKFEDVKVDKKAIFCAPAKVSGFDEMIGLELSLKFDSTKLTFKEVKNFNLSGLTAGSFGVPGVGTNTSGTIKISWISSNPSGFSIPDGNSIFDVCFTAADVDVMTPLEIRYDEAYNAAEQSAPVGNYKSVSTVTIGTGNSSSSSTPKLVLDLGDAIASSLQQEVCLNLKAVSGFSSLKSLQTTILYDPSLLEFTSVKNINLSGLSNSSFSLPGTNSAPGQLGLKWASKNAVSGTSITDGVIICDICFKPKFYDSSANLSFSNNTNTVNKDNTLIGFEGTSGAIFVNSNISNKYVNFDLTDEYALSAGQEVCQKINVANFSDIQTANFSISYNPIQLDFSRIRNLNLSGLSASSFNLPGSGTTPNGTIRVNWEKPSNTTLSIPDGRSIFEVCFLGRLDNINASLSFSDYEVLNTQNQSIAFSGDPGVITIGNSGTLPNGTSLKFNNTNAVLNNEVCLDLSVANFKDILTMEFSLKFDPQLLSFTSLSNLNKSLPFFESPSVKVNNATGQINVSWVNIISQNVTLADNSILFRLCFKVLAAGSCNSPGVQFDMSKRIYFTDLKIQNVPTYTQNGIIAVAGDVAKAPVIQSPTTIKNISCIGETNGSINIEINSGSGNYLYNWSNGASTQDLNNLSPGIYRVTVTDACSGRTTTGSYNISQPNTALRIASTTPSPVTCSDPSSGSIISTVSGGTAPYTYAWNNGSTSANPSNLLAGNYTLTVTDANGCRATSPIVKVNQPSVAITLLSSQVVDARCDGSPTGSIALKPTGGTAPYTYRWSNNKTGEFITGLAAGSYSYTITNAQSCTLTGSLVVGTKSGANIKSTLSKASTANASDGAISLTVSGGQSPYTYKWSKGETSSQISKLAPGQYCVTVIDATQCQATACFTIEFAQAALACRGSDSTALLNLYSATGGPNWEKKWDLRKPINTWYGIKLNAQGCVIEINLENNKLVGRIPAEIGNLRSLISLNLSFNQLSGVLPKQISNLSKLEALLLNNNVLVGPMPKEWAALTQVKQFWVYNNRLAGVIPSFDFPKNADVRIQNNRFGFAGLGEQVKKGYSSFIYAKQDDIYPDTTLKLKPGESKELDLVIDQEVAGNRYGWFKDDKPDTVIQGSNRRMFHNAKRLTTGNYKVSIINPDAPLLTLFSKTIRIEVPCRDTFKVGIIPNKQAVCVGDSVSLSATGGIRYVWSTGQKTTSIRAVVSKNTTFSVSGSNQEGCSEAASIDIKTLPRPEVIPQPSDQDCRSQIEVDVIGGTKPYTYHWNTGGRSDTLNNPAPGIYRVSVTDAQGCTTARSLAVDSTATFGVQSELLQPNCVESTGTVRLKLQGTAPFKIQWFPSNGGEGDTLRKKMPAGKFMAVVQDKRGCIDSLEFEVNKAEGCNEDFVFFNSFTPDGNKVNEYFKIIAKTNQLCPSGDLNNCYPNNELIIFNRWGDPVLRQKGYRNDWNAAKLPGGAYFYAFYPDQEKRDKVIKGAITVLK